MAAVLTSWTQARADYESAAKLAVDPTDRAAVALNQARHYALLADFIRTLDVEKTGAELVASADAAAEHSINNALKTPQIAPLLQGMAKELRAQLAFRRGAASSARKLAEAAQADYLSAGFLAGVENLQRLQGLTSASTKEALGHYRLATLISESLRQRLPADRVGTSQAGFFARKAWVHDKIVELHLRDDQFELALQAIEVARARTLQDCLPKLPQIRRDTDDAVDGVASLLADWPADTVALEYFLGSEQAWVFFINNKGKVQAFKISDADGKPISSRALISQVQRFLQGIEGQSSKMFQRILAKKGFDHQWQDELHVLYQQLVPAAIRKEVQAAGTTVIVPQHVLHYFPFHALVTERDSKERKPTEMVTPRFWIEEPGQRLITPSLTMWDQLRKSAPEPITQVNAIGLVQAPGADALPGVEEDLKNLKAAFGSRVKQVIEGDKATVAAVAKMLQEPGLLFFGTHGHNDGEKPLASFLLLMPSADASKPDEVTGRLSARKVFEDRVEAGVVVMSACYSGLGDRSPLPGDDLFGMQRAFLQSGSRAVVAGLWDVYDGTAPELMKGFFERFQKGEPVAEALQGSQRDFLQKLRASGKTEPYLHPYFWSVYTVIGDARVHFRNTP